MYLGDHALLKMLIAMDYWSTALEQGIPVDVVYLDSSKAF